MCESASESTSAVFIFGFYRYIAIEVNYPRCILKTAKMSEMAAFIGLKGVNGDYFSFLRNPFGDRIICGCF